MTDSKDNFQSLHVLLSGGKYTVAQLATTVEEHGVYGWDRFGRFGISTISGEGGLSRIASNALNALAEYHKFELSLVMVHAPERTEVEQFYQNELNELKLFGWLENALPAINTTEASPPEPKPDAPSKGIHTSTVYKLLRAMTHQTGNCTNNKITHGWPEKIAKVSEQLEGTTEGGKSKGLNPATIRKHLNLAVKAPESKTEI